MKRFVLLTLLVLGIAAMASAQTRGTGWRGQGMPGWNWNNHRIPGFTTENVTVSGELTIVQGSLAVRSGDITYLTMGLHRYIGFIDSLKDGARVSLEGTTISSRRNAESNTRYLLVTKLTIAGRDYDLGRPLPSFPNPRETPNRPETPPQPRQPMQPGRRR